MPSSNDKALVAAIVKYLNSKKGEVSDADSIEVAVSCLMEQFGVSDADVAAAAGDLADTFAKSHASAGDKGAAAAGGASAAEEDPLWKKYLGTITERGFFGADAPGTPGYQAKYAKALQKFQERTKDASSVSATASEPTAPVAAPARANDEATAEARKAEGNAHVAAGRFREAVESYTDAIEAAPSGSQTHIYYNNRAAAKTSLEDYEGAAEDALQAVRLKPDFVKGHTRLGTAFLSGGRYTEAAAAFRAALDLDPTNSFARDNLDKASAAERKAAAKATAASASSAAAAATAAPAAASGGAPRAPAGGMPDLASLAGMLGGGGGGGGAGLGGMLQGLMSNPAVMEAARNLMSNPAQMQGLASMLGGAGGMGNLASMFGGAGAGAGAGAVEEADDAQ